MRMNCQHWSQSFLKKNHKIEVDNEEMATENVTEAEMENAMESGETVVEGGNAKKVNLEKRSRLESVIGK